MTRASHPALAALVALTGCISPESTGSLPAMCEATTDCDTAAGEVCAEGVCWGDPPEEARFAALLVPPGERSDLPVAVFPLLSIGADGWIGGLAFPEAVVARGRVLLACPAGQEPPPYACGLDASIGARIEVERAPSFPGGPTYSRSVVAVAGVGPGQDAFSLLLPRDPDAEYRIRIVPDDEVAKGIAPGQIAPPRQISLVADRDRQVEWLLGEPSQLKRVRGCVENVVGEGTPYSGMTVTALGRWTELSALERASSRSVTDANGCFELSVPRDMLDEFDISVQPSADAILPSVLLRGEFVRDPAEGEEAAHTIEPAIVMPSAPAPTSFRLPIEAQGSAGGQERVGGADVRFVTEFAPPSQNGDRTMEIRFVARATTDPSGEASLALYPAAEANRKYRVTVMPPAGSQFQAAFDRDVAVGIGGAEVLDALTLERRIAVTGLVLQSNEDPVADAPIEARPSSLFRQALDDLRLRDAVADLPVATATTDAEGRFLLWLDRQLVGRSASYDIDLTPPPYSGAPNWSFEDQGVAGEGPVDLGERVLPEASFARAKVRDQADQPVAGAELHLYQLPAASYCTDQMKVDPAECEPPSKLRGIWRSDEAGVVRVVLPDP